MNPEATAPQILIVEDDELTREFVFDLIHSFGYAVTAASDAMEAMKTLEDTPSIVLVFTDIAMPGVDGIMLADMVKQHRPRLKILYTTGGSSISRMKSEAGILHGNILAKPYRPSDLKREIERLLS
ncbi:MAG TPA: response regulator [Alphaproteobacteria bacterium]|jgi:CheY-like chemotaxis protein|nr:response regulator [Alphaproteobacteria bacterium]